MLDRRRRIHTDRDHRRVWRMGQVARSRTVVLRYAPGSTQTTRFGFVVSSAVAKRATIRNLVKRRLRVIARGITIAQPLDVVVYATKASPTATFKDLKQDFIAAFQATTHAQHPYRRH